MTKKNILFFTLLTLFVVTSIITLLGITGKIEIEDKYLMALCTAFLVELAAAVYSWSKNGNILEDEKPEKETIEPLSFIKSELKLQFFGDNRIPQVASSDNVATWFAYFSPSLSIEPKDENGKTVAGGLEVPPNWVVILVFDKPVSYQQATTGFSNPELCPIIDTHSTNSRMVAISTRGQIPAGVLTMEIVE